MRRTPSSSSNTEGNTKIEWKFHVLVLVDDLILEHFRIDVVKWPLRFLGMLLSMNDY